MKYSQDDINNAKEMLNRFIQLGDRVYTITRSVSRSGCSRRIDLYSIGKDGMPQYLSGWAAVLLGEPRPNDFNGIKTDVTGMDASVDMVYRLAFALYGRDGARNLKAERL